MRRLSVVFVLLLAFSVAALAQGEGMKQPTPDEMAKMMAEYEKLGAPGPEHARLAKSAGEWDVTTKMFMGPGQPPMESRGTAVAKTILGGRFVQEEYRGDMMGKPFVGISTVGYDKFKQKYVMSWMDEMSTAMITALGTADPTGKVITYLGKMDEPMTGERDKDVKYIATMIDDDHATFEIWDLVGTPHEFKVMEMSYSRKK